MPDPSLFAPAPDDPGDTRRWEIERLRADIAEINATWGRATRFPDEAVRLEDAILARRLAAASLSYRLDAARRHVGELQAQEHALAAEINGLERGLEALLRQLLEETRAIAAPMWSPIPVFGYRLWWVTAAGLQGATGFVWYRPHLTARCGGAAGSDDGDVPHIDGRCGHPPCGIYALKEAATLLRFGVPSSGEVDGHFVGLVALSGKVVEHDHGYRAQHARVAAGALIDGRGIHASGDPEWIEAMFRNPLGAAASAQPRRGATAFTDAIGFLDECRRREEQEWTLGSRSA